MSVFWIGLIVLAVSSPLLLALVSFRRRTPPDDTLALRLAAALDGTPPELIDPPYRGLCYRIEFRAEGARHELIVGDKGGTLQRLDMQASHACRIFAARLQGRSQEDYLGGRCIVPEGDGWVCVHGEPELQGWEMRLPAGLVGSMRALDIPILIVERTSVQASAYEIGVEWVEGATELLRALETSITAPR